MRLNDDVQKLLYYYHFGTRERIEGEKPERFEVTPEYIRMIRELQNKMMQNIMSKGISIECNPSSNKLIGTFENIRSFALTILDCHGMNTPMKMRSFKSVSIRMIREYLIPRWKMNMHCFMAACKCERIRRATL